TQNRSPCQALIYEHVISFCEDGRFFQHFREHPGCDARKEDGRAVLSLKFCSRYSRISRTFPCWDRQKKLIFWQNCGGFWRRIVQRGLCSLVSWVFIGAFARLEPGAGVV
ncbi:MAG: hypothetical protein ACK57O_19105, partial [Planctomyces sp.]